MTLLRMLVAPVKTTLSLSQDPSYRAHIGFLALSVALSAVVNASAVSTAIEQGASEVARVPELASNAALRWLLDFLATYRKELLTLGTYAVIAIYLLVNFVVLKRFRGHNNVTFGRYFKLFCIASGFYLAAWTMADAFNILALGHDTSAFQKKMISSGAWPALLDYFSSPSGIFIAATTLALVVHHVRVQTNFWGLSTIKVIVSVPLVFIASTVLLVLLDIALLAAIGVRSA
jgi:hypothetical protein